MLEPRETTQALHREPPVTTRPCQAPERACLYVALQATFPALKLSRRAAKAYISAGHVYLPPQREPTTDPRSLVGPSQLIALRTSPRIHHALTLGGQVALQVVHEERDWVAVLKPQGIPTYHPHAVATVAGAAMHCSAIGKAGWDANNDPSKTKWLKPVNHLRNRESGIVVLCREPGKQRVEQVGYSAVVIGRYPELGHPKYGTPSVARSNDHGHVTYLPWVSELSGLTIAGPFSGRPLKNSKTNYICIVSLVFDGLHVSVPPPSKFYADTKAEDDFWTRKAEQALFRTFGNAPSLTDDQRKLMDRAGNKGQPIEYEVGQVRFGDTLFYVNEQVMIPKASSHRLVQEAIRIVHDSPGINHILDLGTGSGNLLLSVLSECPSTRGTGIDISQGALELATRNSNRHSLHERVTFVIGTFDTFDPSGCDMILCNPPYLWKGMCLPRQEPRIALCTPTADTLVFYRHVCGRIMDFPRWNGHVLFEVGWGQADGVEGVVSRRLGQRLGTSWKVSNGHARPEVIVVNVIAIADGGNTTAR